MDEVDLSTVLGYYSFIYLFAQLCLAIQAGNYGFGLVSIEESSDRGLPAEQTGRSTTDLDQ